MMRRTVRRAVLASRVLVPQVLVLLAGGLFSGCAAGPGSTGGCDAGAGARAGGAGFAEVLALSAPTADYAWYPETVTAALPSVTYTGDGAGDGHASELAAVGRFTDWEPGEPDRPNLSTIDLTFAVDEVVGALGDLTMLEGATVTVHVSVHGCADVGRVAEELLGLDDLVLFLDHVGPEPWPPPEWIIVFSSAFLGDVHDDGAITWPVADAIAANNAADHHPEADAGTLDELRAAAAEERTVELSTG
jgi:hypothetical protein